MKERVITDLRPLRDASDTHPAGVSYYCVTCGRRQTHRDGYGCCNESTDSSGGLVESLPVPLFHMIAWNLQRLIALLVDEFNGVAMEWDVLCRLPWTPAELRGFCGPMPLCEGDWFAARRGEDAYPGMAHGYLVLRQESPSGKEARLIATERAIHAYQDHRRRFGITPKAAKRGAP